jgi:hypothetical protein
MTQAQQNMGMEMIGVLTKNNDNNTKMLKKKKDNYLHMAWSHLRKHSVLTIDSSASV